MLRLPSKSQVLRLKVLGFREETGSWVHGKPSLRGLGFRVGRLRGVRGAEDSTSLEFKGRLGIWVGAGPV